MNKKITVDFSVRTVLVVVLSFALIWLVYYLKDIIVLFFVAFVLTTALEPAVDFFEKKKIPRWLTILGLYIFIFSLIYFLFRLIIPPIMIQARHLIENREQIIGSLNHYLDQTPDKVRGAIVDYSNTLPDLLSQYSTSNQVMTNILGVFSGILGVITIFVVSFYLLLEKNTVENFIADYWPFRSRKRAVVVFKQIVAKVSLWARAQLMLSGSIGIFTYLGLTILGMPYALTLSLIAAVTELLPVIGPVIGAVPAIIIAFTISPIVAFWVAILYLGIQQLENHILIPQVMKRVVGLSPVAIIFAILVGAKLLGVLGVIMAVPVASAVSVLLQSIGKKEV